MTINVPEGEESTHLLRAHVWRAAFAVEQNVAFGPLDAGLLGAAVDVVLERKGIPDLSWEPAWGGFHGISLEKRIDTSIAQV